jgi:hypothetical protein
MTPTVTATVPEPNRPRMMKSDAAEPHAVLVNLLVYILSLRCTNFSIRFLPVKYFSNLDNPQCEDFR